MMSSEVPVDTTGCPNSASFRPKLYKIKDDLSEYYELLCEHLVPTLLFDYYMEQKPSIFRKLHAIVIEFGKAIRILFLYFLFYHSIWYSSSHNNHRRNSPINFDLMDVKVFFILIYLNYYHVLIDLVLVKFFLYHFIRSFRILSLYRTKIALNSIEILIYVSIDVYLYYYLRHICDYNLVMISLFLIPHVIFKINHYFYVNLTLFGKCIYRNTYLREDFATEVDLRDYSEPTVPSKYVYTDCSNIPISSILNKKISSPNLYISTGNVNFSKLVPGSDIATETIKVSYGFINKFYLNLCQFFHSI